MGIMLEVQCKPECIVPELKSRARCGWSGCGRRWVAASDYIAANWTFCWSSITFSRKRLSVSIRSLTVWQEWMTVV